jgi:ligand-binding sensor domain-containing protein
LERGLVRNSYEGTEGFEDRSFNSFLRNSNFFIVGRKEYDVFNSTIDYKEQSSSEDIGTRGLVPLSSYELSATEFWIGTEDGIVVLNPSSGFEVSKVIQPGGSGNRIRDIYSFSGFILIVSSYGLYKTSNSGTTFEKIDTTNLPTVMYSAQSFGNTIFIGAEEGIYYSTDRYGDPPYGAWTKCSFKTYAGESIQVVSPCYSIAASSGRFAAVCGRNIFSSTDGINWTREYQFSTTEGATVFKSVLFAERLYMGTNKGIYTDGGTLSSTLVVISPVVFDTSLAVSQSIGINSLWSSSSLYAVGSQPRIYRLQNQTWSSEALSNVDTAHLVTTVLSDTIRVVISNNVVLTG